MDLTHPACWLHSGSAPLHTHLLEHHQGTWHDIHSIAYSPLSPLRTKSAEWNCIYLHSAQRCAHSCTSTGLWWENVTDKHLTALVKLKLRCYYFTKFPKTSTVSFFVSCSNLLLPAHSFWFLSSVSADVAHFPLARLPRRLCQRLVWREPRVQSR